MNKVFEQEKVDRVASNANNRVLQETGAAFVRASIEAKYSYNFSWLGRPIIQYPQDMVGMQELIWMVKPDLIVETGIAHGGSLIFWASLLELNAVCGGPAEAEVIGIDIDIRAHNRQALEAHPMFKRIKLLQGSSVAPEMIAQVQALAAPRQRVMVCLDSNHTHEHVLAELQAYAPLTSVGSYCVVFDTIIEDLPAGSDRPWGPGNNPKTAVQEYLKSHSEFVIDGPVENKLVITVASSGYLRRVC